MRVAGGSLVWQQRAHEPPQREGKSSLTAMLQVHTHSEMDTCKHMKKNYVLCNRGVNVSI